MFTGLVQDIGTVRRLENRGNYRVMTVESRIASEDMVRGESVACDGACLTVVSSDRHSFVVEASQETVARTILSGYTVGTRINLERAMKLSDRLGGHLVSGHIDGTAEVDYLKRVGESWELAVIFDSAHDNLVVSKGSLAVNGVSLTINDNRSGWLRVNIIPHTYESTTLADLKTGTRLNLEFDLIGKYIAKMMAGNIATGLTMDKLRRSGW